MATPPKKVYICGKPFYEVTEHTTDAPVYSKKEACALARGKSIATSE